MKEKKIFIPIWDGEIILIYGNQEKAYKYIDKKHNGLDVSKYVGSQGNHFKVISNDDSRSYSYLVIYEGYNNHTVYHESLHAAWELLNDRLVEVSYDNQEPLAYLVDYISNEVLIQLNEWSHG